MTSKTTVDLGTILNIEDLSELLLTLKSAESIPDLPDTLFGTDSPAEFADTHLDRVISRMETDEYQETGSAEIDGITLTVDPDTNTDQIRYTLLALDYEAQTETQKADLHGEPHTHAVKTRAVYDDLRNGVSEKHSLEYSDESVTYDGELPDPATQI